jgi:hypothetical protein
MMKLKQSAFLCKFPNPSRSASYRIRCFSTSKKEKLEQEIFKNAYEKSKLEVE